jgi:TDG/mug DNA glycosylase family protein
MTYSRPSKDQLSAAVGKTISDLIAPNLQVLFCGINPSLYSAVVGHHFARPGNRFWPALHHSGFTPRLLHPSQEAELLRYGLGITNIYEHATATAAELSRQQIAAGGARLQARVLTYMPRVLAVLGISAYRTAFDRPEAKLGLQSDRLADTIVWVLPNPSGLNAHFQLPELAAVFRDLRLFAEQHK